MSRFKKLSKVRCQQPLVCWHGSVAFLILPIHIANLSRLSKCNLPIIMIPKPLKLSNSQISYPIWQMSIPDVCVTSGRWSSIATFRWISEQLWGMTCDNTVVMLSFKQNEYYFAWLCIDLLVTIAYFAMRSRRNTDVLKCPSLPVVNIACCACARISDGALGKIIAAKKAPGAGRLQAWGSGLYL